MGDLGVRLGLGLDSIQGIFRIIIETTSSGLDPPCLTGFAEYSLLPDTGLCTREYKMLVISWR